MRFWILALVLTFQMNAQAQVLCRKAIDNKTDVYSATPSEIKELRETYPKFAKRIDDMKKAVLNFPFSKDFQKAKTMEEIDQITSIRNYDSSFKKEEFKNLDSKLRKTIVEVFNQLQNSKDLAKYVEELMQDCGVYMMKNSDMKARKTQDLASVRSAEISGEYVTKKDFLENGNIDHLTLLKVLSHRIKARGETMTYILPNGNYNGNKSKTQKYEVFYEVPFRGPFIDGAFTAHSSHGQDVHLLQMDFVSMTIEKHTNGNPRLFWDYVTTKGQGAWVWDTFFDGTDGSIRHPEKVGPLLMNHIPLY